jgi:hypothetical protein
VSGTIDPEYRSTVEDTLVFHEGTTLKRLLRPGKLKIKPVPSQKTKPHLPEKNDHRTERTTIMSVTGLYTPMSDTGP